MRYHPWMRADSLTCPRYDWGMKILLLNAGGTAIGIVIARVLWLAIFGEIR